MSDIHKDSAIIVEHLHKHYGEFAAVNDLSFTVARGKCTAFLGPNGAGKTTTIKTLYGKARYDTHPETKIEVLGFRMPKQELEIKSFIGVVPQDNSLDEELDVEQNLYIYAKLHQMPRKRALERIGELLEFMELTEKRKNKCKELSGGMQRRLVIARAMLNSPRLLILDEPTTGLDPQVRQLIWDKLRALMREGVTILLTTHYMDEAFQISDDIIIMDKGVKVLQGSPHALMQEHMETHVLEIHRPEALGDNSPAAKLLTEYEAAKRLRKEGSSSRVLLYSSDRPALENLSKALAAGSFLERHTNLEDLFLKTTGRSLNE